MNPASPVPKLGLTQHCSVTWCHHMSMQVLEASSLKAKVNLVMWELQ